MSYTKIIKSRREEDNVEDEEEIEEFDFQKEENDDFEEESTEVKL